jgi:hypothetical protein
MLHPLGFTNLRFSSLTLRGVFRFSLVDVNHYHLLDLQRAVKATTGTSKSRHKATETRTKHTANHLHPAVVFWLWWCVDH